jgi:homopolymeric O-antigen transport system ATP-binding protein
MTVPAISVHDIGKEYEIGGGRGPGDRLTEALSAAIRRTGSVRGYRRDRQWIWALRNVTFDVNAGEAVGVIGRNGSGKSTLLKVLSRITDPTTGTATLRGRVGTLLEVGTGFHPELSGRENIFLSGAVLGMSRTEIKQKFDEIVDFSGVEQFLDTPVKRFSTGMQVRLGFAVAAHLDPEILFVDEVLAVGDADFQKKCLGKMSDLGMGGRTILFVSHSMPAVLRLCRKAVLLDGGQVAAIGPSHEVVRAYMESDVGRTSERRWDDPATAPGGDVAKLHSIRVFPTAGGPGDEIDIREPISIEVQYWAGRGAPTPLIVNVDAFNDDGVCIFALSDEAGASKLGPRRETGLVRSICSIPGNFFSEGRVTLNVAVVSHDPRIGHAVELDAVAFQVVDRSEGDGARGTSGADWPGVVRPKFDWSVHWLSGATNDEDGRSG